MQINTDIYKKKKKISHLCDLGSQLVKFVLNKIELM